MFEALTKPKPIRRDTTISLPKAIEHLDKDHVTNTKVCKISKQPLENVMNS